MDPKACEKLPPGHATQAPSPGESEKSPGLHRVQEEVLAEKLPASQAVQLIAPSTSLTNPSAQAAHAGAPGEDENSPLLHTVHKIGDSENDPVSHFEQFVAPV